jgi:hypothetical protein
MRTWQAVEEMVVQDLSEPVETVKTCRMWCIQKGI